MFESLLKTRGIPARFVYQPLLQLGLRPRTLAAPETLY